jgi:hypothetical protein
MNAGSTTRGGHTVAEATAGAQRHGQPLVEGFMDEVVAEYRRRLALLGDCGDRRAVEDGIALMLAQRPDGMDSAHFEKLLSTLCAGRSPVGQHVLRPEAIGHDLARRWREYAGGIPATN